MTGFGKALCVGLCGTVIVTSMTDFKGNLGCNYSALFPMFALSGAVENNGGDESGEISKHSEKTRIVYSFKIAEFFCQLFG